MQCIYCNRLNSRTLPHIIVGAIASFIVDGFFCCNMICGSVKYLNQQQISNYDQLDSYDIGNLNLIMGFSSVKTVIYMKFFKFSIPYILATGYVYGNWKNHFIGGNVFGNEFGVFYKE